MAEETIQNIARALTHDRPLFGICLGNQLLATALGGEVDRLLDSTPPGPARSHLVKEMHELEG